MTDNNDNDANDGNFDDILGKILRASFRDTPSLDLDLAFGAVDSNVDLACARLLFPPSPLPPPCPSAPSSATTGEPFGDPGVFTIIIIFFPYSWMSCNKLFSLSVPLNSASGFWSHSAHWRCSSSPSTASNSTLIASMSVHAAARVVVIVWPSAHGESLSSESMFAASVSSGAGRSSSTPGQRPRHVNEPSKACARCRTEPSAGGCARRPTFLACFRHCKQPHAPGWMPRIQRQGAECPRQRLRLIVQQSFAPIHAGTQII